MLPKWQQFPNASAEPRVLLLILQHVIVPLISNCHRVDGLHMLLWPSRLASDVQAVAPVSGSRTAMNPGPHDVSRHASGASSVLVFLANHDNSVSLLVS